MRPETKRWTAEEDDVLRQEALAGGSVSDIASKLGRSEAAVRTRAYTLRVPLRTVGIRRRESAW
jgi:DNA-directed RNA polymerase specialized sigma24 family protein